jgi:hypothetical protein
MVKSYLARSVRLVKFKCWRLFLNSFNDCACIGLFVGRRGTVMTRDRGTYYGTKDVPIIFAIEAVAPGGSQYPATDYTWSSSDPTNFPLAATENPYEYSVTGAVLGSYVVMVTHGPTADAETLTTILQAPAGVSGDIGLSARI